MVVVQLLIFVLLFLVAPLAVGGIFWDSKSRPGGAVFAWVSGQILLWAVFQAICVPLILLEKSFVLVEVLFSGAMVLLAVSGVFCFAWRRNKAGSSARESHGREKDLFVNRVLWVLFWVLILVQLVLAVFLAYEEGDDAYYVALTTATVDSDTMYMKLPYTGGHTGLDARHGLAPFPVWVAYMADLTGITAVTMAQIVLPIGLILMTYGIYYLIGRELLWQKRHLLPLFMILITVIVYFGGYSTYSAENFLLVRTVQGKAVIANIVIPFMVYLWLKVLNALETKEKVSGKYWLLIGLAMAVGCLCSTLGSLLTCMLVGIVGICAIVCYRKWRMLVPMVVSCVYPVVCAALYFLISLYE